MKRTISFLLVLFFISLTGLSSQPTVHFAVELSDSLYASVPHFQDELPLRTSNAIALAVGVFGIHTESFSTTLDLNALFVTPSIPFGNYQSRGFNSIGLRVRGSYQFNPQWALYTAFGAEVNYYQAIQEAFISYSLAVGPQWRVLQLKAQTLDIIFPVTVHMRKEITAPMLGVGIRYTLSHLKKEDS